MPDGNRHLRDSGKTVIDGLVACAVVALVGCMVLPVLSKERDDARIAVCADHLRQLGQAAHQYAADFEGKFFYHWTSGAGPDGKMLPPEMIGSWHDQKRVGRYIEGQPMTLRFAASPSRPEKIVDLGLGWGPFRCPSDLPDGARSYDMNYWAVTSLDTGGPERRLAERLVNAEARFRDKFEWSQPISGIRFDTSARQPDRVLLFSEAFETIKTSDEWWVTGGLIGVGGLPGERFGGRQDGVPGVIDGNGQTYGRYHVSVLPTRLDYARHGDNQNRHLPLGAINVAFVDGHVAQVQSTELFHPDTRRSTYKVLWSENDALIESPDIQ